MNLIYRGMSGIDYEIEEKKIAGGGEGGIYPIKGNADQVAKIYKETKKTKEREEKILHMVQIKLSEEQLQQVIWPQDVIYDNSGFAGYIMPKLKYTDSISAIYSNGMDNKYDLRYRLLAAYNLCAALKTVHDMNQVCGDLNPRNICINLDKNDKENGFHISLVDVDSYQFNAEGETYRCEVGLAEYIAPEIQKKISGNVTLKNAPLPTYTKESDLFALAVHIFTLLMNGCHPFACARQTNGGTEENMTQMQSQKIQDSVVAPQPIDNIRDGFFPFYEKRAGITRPVYAPSFESLPGKLRELFVRTFVDGDLSPDKRADTQEWMDALKTVTAGLSLCSGLRKLDITYPDIQHYFFDHNTECPFCNVFAAMQSWVPGASDLPEDSSESGDDPPETPQSAESYKGAKLWALCPMWVLLGFYTVSIDLVGLWLAARETSLLMFYSSILTLFVISPLVLLFSKRSFGHDVTAFMCIFEGLWYFIDFIEIEKAGIPIFLLVLESLCVVNVFVHFYYARKKGKAG